jgi:hypothetical protein
MRIVRVCAVTFIQIIPNLTGDKSTSAYPFYGFHLLFFNSASTVAAYFLYTATFTSFDIS